MILLGLPKRGNICIITLKPSISLFFIKIYSYFNVPLPLKTLLVCLFFVFFASHESFSQHKINELKITRATDAIVVDGELSEDCWHNASVANGFRQNFPYDTGYANAQTEVMMCYDQDKLYVAAICHDKIKGNYVIQSLKRDFSFPVTDAFAVTIDPFGDKLNGFSFGVSPYGVQREGMIYDGGTAGVSTDWDNKWYSAVKIKEDRWVVEFSIPFSSLRFKPGSQQWRINFARNDLKRNEISTWIPVPRNFNIASLAFTGELNWDEPKVKTGNNISIIPYLISQNGLDKEKNIAPNAKVNGGLDAKIAITSSMNMDLTINPDFSQTEVDRQVINLTRFDIAYPERRNFFLENNDLFGQFGFSAIRPFFSRQIGLTYDDKAKLFKEIPILFGARLSGKLNKNWRLGVMAIQTDRSKYLKASSQNYSVLAIQRQLFSRSTIAFIFANKQSFGTDSTSDYRYQSNQFNRVVGVDYNLNSTDSKWKGKAFFHQALQPIMLPRQYTHASFMSYNSSKLQLQWNHEYVGTNFNAEIGYVLRKNYWRIEPSVKWIYYPKSTMVNNFGFKIYNSTYWNNVFKLTDRTFQFVYDLNLQNSAKLSLTVSNDYVVLLKKFVVLGYVDTLVKDKAFLNNTIEMMLQSNLRKKLNALITSSYGAFFDGNRIKVETGITYRFQPWGNITMNYNVYKLYRPIGNKNLTIIGPRIEVTLSKSVFFTTFVQYNTAIDNLNINARLQWRYKPVSDFYIVYTDNYTAEYLNSKNRALVLKWNYWFNL